MSNARRIWCFAKTLLVFLLLGPPIGALMMMGMLATVGLVNADGATAKDVATIVLFALIYAVPLSYLMGAIPAGIVGAVSGARQIWRGPVAWWLALIIGLAAGLWLYRAGGGPFPTGADGQPERSSQTLRLATMIATCLVPTMVCWSLTRGKGKGPKVT